MNNSPCGERNSGAPCRGAYLLALAWRIEEIALLRLARGALPYESSEFFTASGSEHQNKVKNARVRIEKNPPLRGRIEKNSPCGE